MKRIAESAVGIASGSELLFSAYEDGGEMWTGRGPRLLVRHVTFEERFRAAPTVQLSMTMWDTDASVNQRMDIQATAVTETGFDIEFRTWDNSRVARVRAGWMAIGPVRYVDNWDFED